MTLKILRRKDRRVGIIRRKSKFEKLFTIWGLAKLFFNIKDEKKQESEK